MIIFVTERFQVRTLRESDGDFYFALHGDPEIMRYIRPAKSRDDCDLLLSQHIDINNQLAPYGRWLVFDRNNGDFIGSFVIIPIEKTDFMQLGYSLLKKNWGRGYATELIRGGLQYTFTKTHLAAIYAVVEEGNIASQKALLKCGFTEDIILVDGEKRLHRYVKKKESLGVDL